MGKTAAGEVWLNPDRFSPYEYRQHWRNTEDADVGRFLRLFKELPLDEIARLEALGGAEINEAKKILPTEATALCHGREAAHEAAETARRTFEEKPARVQRGHRVRGGSGPSYCRPASRPRDPAGAPRRGLPAYDLLREAGLVRSNSEARRLIRGRGARVNDEPVRDGTGTVGPGDLTPEGAIKLSAGRKRHALVRVSGRPAPRGC